MTAQKGLFTGVPNYSVYPIDTPVQTTNTPTRFRQRWLCILLVLAAILVLSAVIAVVAFMCLKGVDHQCESCELEITEDEAANDRLIGATPVHNFADGFGPNRLLTTIATKIPITTTWRVASTPAPETKDDAPPRSEIATLTGTHQSEGGESKEDLPWYARLPLVGWLFRESEKEEVTARLSISSA